MRPAAKRLAFLTQGLFAALALPPELVTFERIAEELRVPFATKIHDMRSNYGLRETSPGFAWTYVDDSGDPQLVVHRTKQLSPAKDNSHENVQFIAWGTVVYEETIDTIGKNLAETDLEQRLLFDSASGYSLQSDTASGLEEREKTIRISVGRAPVLRYALRKSEVSVPHSTTVTMDMSIGEKPVLKITDLASDDPALRTYTYTVLTDSFVTKAFNNAMLVKGLSQNGIYQVRVEKPKGYARAQTTYLANDEKYFSFDGFMNEFNSGIYEKIVTQGNLPLFNELVEEEFPRTMRRQNPAQGGKLLEELTQIFTKLQAPTLTPADQILIRNRILGYMDAVRDGSLIDHRKDSSAGKR